jgi:hypothetical protein
VREWLHSIQRAQALAEVAHRYAAVVTGLTAAVGEVLPALDGEARVRLEAAVRDAEAQVSAAGDALDAAFADLPEGRGEV